MKSEKEINIILRSWKPDTDMLNVVEVLNYNQISFSG